MFQRVAIIIILIITTLPSLIGQESAVSVIEGDTIRYRYTPLLIKNHPNNFVSKVMGYFDRQSIDKSFEKGIDIGVGGGVSYWFHNVFNILVQVFDSSHFIGCQ